MIRFLGRVISRRKGERSLLVSLPPEYLDGTFEDCGLVGNASKIATHPPDVAAFVEKEGGIPLTPEAFSRFRSALGPIAWLTQTRQNLRAYISILACQQSSPTNHTEAGLRSLMHYLQNDMLVAVRLPVENEVVAQRLHFGDKPHMVCYSDASHAPLRTTKRRGISGGVLIVFGCTIRTLSRRQQLISLSSMESELFAVQIVAQEMVSLGKVCARMLRSFGETEKEQIPGGLFTDSKPALKLPKNLDIPKRSRHLEIRVEWLKGRVILERGVGNPSDMLTKCLSSSVFGVHRESLGFEKMARPICSLASLGRKMIFVEVCCQEHSSISKACLNIGLTYCGIVKEMETHKTFMGLKTF